MQYNRPAGERLVDWPEVMAKIPVNVSALSGRAFQQDRELERGFPGAFDKAVL